MAMTRPSRPPPTFALRASRRALAITLGSGLDEVVGSMRTQVRIPYRLIPHFPGTTVQGHGGTLHWGPGNMFRWPFWKAGYTITKDMPRLPLYFPCVSWRWRASQTFVLTCAAGGIAPKSKPGGVHGFLRPPASAGSESPRGRSRPALGSAIRGFDRGLRSAACATSRGKRRANCVSLASKAFMLRCLGLRMRRRRKSAPSETWAPMRWECPRCRK